MYIHSCKCNRGLIGGLNQVATVGEKSLENGKNQVRKKSGNLIFSQRTYKK